MFEKCTSKIAILSPFVTLDDFVGKKIKRLVSKLLI